MRYALFIRRIAPDTTDWTPMVWTYGYESEENGTYATAEEAETQRSKIRIPANVEVKVDVYAAT